LDSPTDDTTAWRLEWNDGLSVHIPEIDAEHRHFILLVNELNEALIGRMAVSEIRKRMQALMDDAAAHFAHEQRLFAEWGYPAAGEHADKHAVIMQALEGIMGRFESGGMDYEWVEAGLKIKKILVAHLLHDDMKYRDFYLAGRSGASGPAEGSPRQGS
jgi:hemerythrin-like metal-binding protein